MKLAQLVALAGLGIVAFATNVHAQNWPNRPIRFVVPASAGGSLDTLSRPLAQKLTEVLGQQVVVENRGGAAGMIGAEAVAKSAPDGYTFLMGAVHHAIIPSVYSKVPYDTDKDFAPVTLIATVPNVVIVNPALPVKSVKDLVDYAKAHPGKLNYGTGGAGTSHHLGTELFKGMTGIDMQPVHYKGSAPAITDLMAGQIQLMFETMPSATAHIKSGKLRAIAVTTAKRAPLFPDVPTVAESGYGDFDISTWYGILAPAGTPPDIVNRMQAAVAKTFQSEDMKTLWASLGAEPGGNSAEAFQKFWRGEIRRWAKVAKDSGARVD